MTQHKRILTDIDGVVLFWWKAFKEFMASRGHHPNADEAIHYELHKCFNVPDYEMDILVHEFNNSDRIGALNPMPDAVEYLTKLRKEEGYSFVGITSLSSVAATRIKRIENINTLFGDDMFEDVICLAMHSSKRDTLEKWKGKAQYWIEDHARNAIDGHELGFKTFLVTHAHNAHVSVPDGIARVPYKTAWHDIYQVIKNK